MRRSIGLSLIALTFVLGLHDAASAAAARAAPPAEPAASAAETQAPLHRFDLQELRVEGNTVLSERDIDDVVYPFLGPEKTSEDVEHARMALEEAYSKRGYATVSVVVPPQVPVDGVVIVNVVERPIGRLRVVGAQYYAPRVIRQRAPSLVEGKVPNLNAVQSDIVGLNQDPDLAVTPSLREGRAPDTVDVDLKVEDKLPFHGSLEINNRNNQGTTPLRLNGQLSYGNLWQRGDTASFSFQVAPQNYNDASVYSGSYSFHVPNSNVQLYANYIHSDSNVVTLGGTNAIGRGDTFQFRGIVPLGTLDDFTHSLSAGFDYKNVHEIIGLSGQESDAPVTYWPFRVTYNAGWSEPNSTTDVVGSLVWSFRGLGNSQTYFDNKRFNATTNFVYLTADASRTQELPYNLEGYVRAVTQISPQPLVSNEQLSVGGADTVRGYFESEALGDYGVVGQSELRSPDLAKYIGAPLNSLRAFGFADIGAADIRSPLPEQSASAVLASVGAGLRFRLYDHLSGYVENAIALHDGPATHAGSDHVLFSLSGDF